MPRLIANLTDSKIKSTISTQKKPFEKIIKLSDGGGLYLLLDKKGGTYWRLDYISDSAKRMRCKASQVFQYAIALGLCQFNVAEKLVEFSKSVKLSIDRLLLMNNYLR